MRHINGVSRQQGTLLPETLDDYVAGDHPVRVIDAFIDHLDLADLGFSKSITKQTGRKPYHPGDLLKLYIYGYLNQVHSSRRLEKECHRNLEVIWLMKRLCPDFKTIADFRKDNGDAIRLASRQFVLMLRQAGEINYQLVAIDGSKFRACASNDRCFTRTQYQQQAAQVDAKLAHYLEQLDASDAQESGTVTQTEYIKQMLEVLAEQKAYLNEVFDAMDAQGSQQYCTTEPEAKRLRSGREGKIVSYNVQSAVDVGSGLIVHFDVNNEATDNRQLLPMSLAVKEQAEVEELAVVADAGYSNGQQLHECESIGIYPAVPANRSPNTTGNYYQKSEFRYDADDDAFICPAGEKLRYTTKQTRKKHLMYSRKGCSKCRLQSQCTKADQRWLTRHFYEEAFERSKSRLDAEPLLMKIRMAAVERPFAVIKHHLGLRRFHCRGLNKAKTEISLGILAYNLKHMMKKLGVRRLVEIIAT
jgi:transposase